MITKANAKKILDITLSSGADFGELFFEDTIESSLKLENGVVSKVNSGNVYGCGIRILKKDLNCFYDQGFISRIIYHYVMIRRIFRHIVYYKDISILWALK